MEGTKQVKKVLKLNDADRKILRAYSNLEHENGVRTTPEPAKNNNDIHKMS